LIGAALLLLAIPADLRLSLHAGEHHIEKIDWRVETVETEGPLRAELLPSGNELLLEPVSKGVARAFVFTRREVRVIEAFIDTPLPPPAEKPACATVKDAACYAQFRAAPQPRMVFDLEGLQAEAKAAQDELHKAGLDDVLVAISPWGVKLKGAKSPAEKRQALKAIWPAILGPLRLDD
jgi:hypothetical protein